MQLQKKKQNKIMAPSISKYKNIYLIVIYKLRKYQLTIINVHKLDLHAKTPTGQ